MESAQVAATSPLLPLVVSSQDRNRTFPLPMICLPPLTSLSFSVRKYLFATPIQVLKETTIGLDRIGFIMGWTFSLMHMGLCMTLLYMSHVQPSSSDMDYYKLWLIGHCILHSITLWILPRYYSVNLNSSGDHNFSEDRPLSSARKSLVFYVESVYLFNYVFGSLLVLSCPPTSFQGLDSFSFIKMSLADAAYYYILFSIGIYWCYIFIYWWFIMYPILLFMRYPRGTLIFFGILAVIAILDYFVVRRGCGLRFRHRSRLSPNDHDQQESEATEDLISSLPPVLRFVSKKTHVAMVSIDMSDSINEKDLPLSSPSSFDKSATLEFDDENDAECAICLCPYEDGDSLRRMKCLHHFHAECIDSWVTLRPTCPLCVSRV